MQLDGGVWDVYDFDPLDQPSRGIGSEEDKQALHAWGGAPSARAERTSQLTQVKYSASSSSGSLPQRTVGHDWDPVGICPSLRSGSPKGTGGIGCPARRLPA